jgi:hypothetical protein
MVICRHPVPLCTSHDAARGPRGSGFAFAASTARCLTRSSAARVAGLPSRSDMRKLYFEGADPETPRLATTDAGGAACMVLNANPQPFCG